MDGLIDIELNRKVPTNSSAVDNEIIDEKLPFGVQRLLNEFKCLKFENNTFECKVRHRVRNFGQKYILMESLNLVKNRNIRDFKR